MKEVWNSFGRYSTTRSNHAQVFFELPAVRAGRVFAVDANSYFARPGPRVIEGAEVLAQIIHPELFEQSAHSASFQPVDVSLLQGILDPERDYVVENGAMVFTASYLQRRGYCCDSGCRNCPY
jgi:iron complex transport system substrate-binding protein